MGISESSQREPAVIQPTRAPPKQPYESYEYIRSPTFDDMRAAAYIFDQISHRAAFAYACVGSFAAQFLSGFDYQIYDLEVLIDKNDVQRLGNLAWDFPEYLAVTATRQQIVVIRGNKGISMQFSTTGDGPGDYTNALIPPRNSAARTVLHGTSDATFSYRSLNYPQNDRAVPVLQPHLLMRQRLLRFNPRAIDYLEVKRLQRDIDDIRVLLKCTKQTLPVTLFEANRFLPIVKEWLVFAESNGLLTSWEDVNAWRSLGFDLGIDSISKPLRGICVPVSTAGRDSGSVTAAGTGQRPLLNIPSM